MTWKWILLPFSVLYGLGVRLRNAFFDTGILKSTGYEVPVICVGNLSAGGTGKTPHVEYLIRLLSNRYKLATLSRGYGRKTNGYREVTQLDDASTAGDEPVQYKGKFPWITVAVCESRREGIEMLLYNPQPEVIVLDDAYQHRYVKPSLNILLTEWSKPYCNDWLLPAGRLREPVSGSKRADIIIVTKCPVSLDPTEKEVLLRNLSPYPYQKVFFSSTSYHDLAPVNGAAVALKEVSGYSVLMVTGIADPGPMKTYLKGRFNEVHTMIYNDHHRFNERDCSNILEKFDNIAGPAIIVTTEKDFTRLRDFQLQRPLFVLPVSVKFGEEEKIAFEQYIINHVGKN